MMIGNVEEASRIQKLIRKKQHTLNIGYELKQLSSVLKDLPKSDEEFKMLSIGAFSSISLIKFIADKEPIKKLYVSTFRVGQKQFGILNKLHEEGKLEEAHILTSTTQRNTDKNYRYFTYIKNKCAENGWELKVLNNHSKLILAETDDNYYVIETSSNLNENPKIEQFSFLNDKNVYEFYKDLLVDLLKEGSV